jgi:hypothetical protein
MIASPRAVAQGDGFKASSADVARIAAVVASDFRFTYFGTGAFAVAVAP